MKIKSLQFYDYRVFYAETVLDKEDYFIQVDSKNLLVYGENGSGKTSLFRGLKDIIHQEDFTSHFKTLILNDGYVEITFDDNTTDKFDATGAKASKSELLNISKLNSFLSYKELLQTHFSEDLEINFFKIIVNNILKEHNLPTLGQLQIAWETLKARDIEQEKSEIAASVPAEISEDEAQEQIDKLDSDYDVQITKFNDEFDELLESINAGSGEILKYFNQDIAIKFELEKLTRANLSSPELYAKVDYAAFNLTSHHKFLNEARLSAIAISVYLTALQTNPTTGAIKIIFLDDIFLGLDLNNRLPLLDILKDRFSDWQIFLTTYDRHWFEVAKQHLDKTNWKAIEMYAASVEGKPFDKPVIIQSENYFSKAGKYFLAGDYPASLNYLRKELESLIKERLPEESTRHFEGKPHGLNHLWDVLVDRYNTIGKSFLITEELRSELKTVRFSLLNPQSHDNLSAPVYKYELVRVFKLIEKIRKIPIIRGVTLLSSGMELTFKHPTVSYTLTLELLQDWRLELEGASKEHHYPTCRLKHWQFNGNDYYNTHDNKIANKPEKLPEEKLNKVRSIIIGQAILQPLSEELFNSNTAFEGIWTIKELLEKCNNQRRDNWFCRIFRK